MPLGLWMMRTAVSFFCMCCPPGPEGAAGLDGEIVRVQLDFDLFHFGEHGDGGGGGMDAALGFGDGDALDAVHAAFELEQPVGAAALDRHDGFFDAADVAGGFGHHLRLPPGALGEAHIHAQQIAGEDAGLFPAGAGADFEDAVPVVVRVAGGQLFFEFRFQLFVPRAEALQFLGQLEVVPFGEQHGSFFEVAFDAQEVAEQFHGRLQHARGPWRVLASCEDRRALPAGRAARPGHRTGRSVRRVFVAWRY